MLLICSCTTQSLIPNSHPLCSIEVFSYYKLIIGLILIRYHSCTHTQAESSTHILFGEFWKYPFHKYFFFFTLLYFAFLSFIDFKYVPWDLHTFKCKTGIGTVLVAHTVSRAPWRFSAGHSQSAVNLTWKNYEIHI